MNFYSKRKAGFQANWLLVSEHQIFQCSTFTLFLGFTHFWFIISWPGEHLLLVRYTISMHFCTYYFWKYIFLIFISFLRFLYNIFLSYSLPSPNSSQIHTPFPYSFNFVASSSFFFFCSILKGTSRSDPILPSFRDFSGRGVERL